MPITLTVPEGLLSSDAESQVFAALTQALLDVTELSGNTFMEPNIVGTINVLPRQHVFAGGRAAPAAFIELKLPSIALSADEVKRAFIERATDVVERAAEGRVRRDHIWTNIVYAADGSWGIGGRSFTNGELVAEIQNSVQSVAAA